MLVGLAPISAYRTLDLPAVPELTSLTQGPMSAPAIEPLVTAALRATGTGVRVFDPIENRREQVLGREDAALRETIEDPALASWLFGASWVADHGPWARTFSIWRRREHAGPGLAGPSRRDPRAGDAGGLVGRSPRDPGHLRRRRATGGRVGSARGMDHFGRGRTSRPG